MLNKLYLFHIVSSCILLHCYAAPMGELVKSLPSINFVPNFRHFSGYLQPSPTHFLHYWFLESQNNPSTDPVLLWLNGGPGCSSLSGLLDELGPFKALDYGATLGENPYAWNKVANVIFLEAPAGVGFSYSTDGNITTDDHLTAFENHQALLQWFMKFPEYRSHDFFISGESYAGVYLPTLGSLLVQDATNFPNFKGVLSGNGAHNFYMLYNTVVPFLYYHNVISESKWANLSSKCCNGNPYVCNYYSNLNNIGSYCSKTVDQALFIPQSLGLYYDLYYKCYIPTDSVKHAQKVAFINTLNRIAGINYRHQSQSEDEKGALPRCAHYNDTTIYLNRADVRAALHIPSNLPPWTNCKCDTLDWGQIQCIVNKPLTSKRLQAKILFSSKKVVYIVDEFHFELNEHYYHVVVLDTSSYWKTIVNAGKRVLMYNGDVDTACNSILNQQFASQLGFTLLKDKKPWRYQNVRPSNAGFVTQYQGLDYVTVRGAGHFVPDSNPREALQMVTNFMRNTGSYSLPTNVNVKPSPPVNGYCAKVIPMPGFIGGSMVMGNLCGGNGICVSSPTRAHCNCAVGWTGPLCQTLLTPATTSMVQLCAAYWTPQVALQKLPSHCPRGRTCLPFRPECIISKKCTMPVGYCIPSVHITTPTRNKLRNLRRVNGRLISRNMKNIANVNRYNVNK